MLQEVDAARIEALERRLRARTKIEVVRSALDLLEQSAERAARVARWRRAAGMVAAQSRTVPKEFQRHSRPRRLD